MFSSLTFPGRRVAPSMLFGALLCVGSVASQVQAATISDPAGDFLSTFAGSTNSKDLDIVSASATYDATTDTFVLSSTSAGAIGSTATALYVWGVNEGTGKAGFAANGLPDVLFDQVILLRPDGTGNAGGAALPAGAVTVSGNTLTASISGALLPSKGFAKGDYTWNLWPRDTAFSSKGFGAIADFAPDKVNFATTSAVPEPATYALMGVGLLLVGLAGRRAQAPRKCLR